MCAQMGGWAFWSQYIWLYVFQEPFILFELKAGSLNLLMRSSLSLPVRIFVRQSVNYPVGASGHHHNQSMHASTSTEIWPLSRSATLRRTWASAECLLFTSPGSLNVCVRVKEIDWVEIKCKKKRVICVRVWVNVCLLMHATNPHASLSMTSHVFMCGREFSTRSVKWWLPSDNKQRDLLSMTERSRTWFLPVMEASFKLLQSPHCLSLHQKLPAGVCVVFTVSHPLERCWWAPFKLQAVWWKPYMQECPETTIVT